MGSYNAWNFVKLATDEQLVEFFKQADTDGSGFLTRDEVRAVLRKNGYNLSDKQFEDAFYEIDCPDDGRISLDDYLVVMKGQPEIKHKGAAVRRVFQLWDKDANGRIYRSELDQIMKELGKHFPDTDLRRMVEVMDAGSTFTIDYNKFAKKVFGVDA